MFDNIKVFKTKIVSPIKKHQCIKCGSKIKVKQECINTTYSYDGRLLSVYFCNSKECSCNHKFFSTTKNYIRVKKCTECGFIKYK